MLTACTHLWAPNTAFAESQDVIDTLDEATSLLTLDELKAIAKEEKLTGTTKPQLVAALKRSATAQGRLGLEGQLTIRFDVKGLYASRERSFVGKILDITGTITSNYSINNNTNTHTYPLPLPRPLHPPPPHPNNPLPPRAPRLLPLDRIH